MKPELTQLHLSIDNNVNATNVALVPSGFGHYQSLTTLDFPMTKQDTRYPAALPQHYVHYGCIRKMRNRRIDKACC